MVFSISRTVEEDKYETQAKRLGEGGQGTVRLSLRKVDLKFVALKVMQKSFESSKRSKARPREIRILLDILPEHRNINKLLDVFEKPRKWHLYYELYDGGDLADVCFNYVDRRKTLPEFFIWHIFAEMIEALAFIHHGLLKESNGVYSRPSSWRTIVHRDIKPENIFVHFGGQRSRMPRIVLGDFGCAADTSDPRETDHYYGGTASYQPPELPSATAKGDVWAIGGVVHFLSTKGCPPIRAIPQGWPQNAESQKMGNLHPEARHLHVIDDVYSPEIQYWMRMACGKLAEDRPTSEYLLKHMVVHIARARSEKGRVQLPDWAFPPSFVLR
ncbi:MAG: G2-specific serine/threonine protein kinase [Pycnora praestabilis]|nr:MAG: G2-specific serine/threonine protein kinase [Pycnora praestabilis]